MNTKQVINYGLYLYQLRSDILKLGCMQPVKWMINMDIWHEDKDNHNYLSGRMVNKEFIVALERLKNQLENE